MFAQHAHKKDAYNVTLQLSALYVIMKAITLKVMCAYKYVEMENCFSWSAMMEIMKMGMDALLNARYKMIILVVEGLQ